MKNLIFTITLLLTTGFFSFAQEYDLSFKWKLVPAADRTDERLDTVNMNGTYLLMGTVENNSDVDYSGQIEFNYYADRQADGSDTNIIEGTFGPISISVPAFGSFNFLTDLTIDPKVFNDSTNVVIVWPTVGFKDKERSNNYGSFTVFVFGSGDETSIGNTAKFTTFKLYPNPARNIFVIETESLGRNAISITDISGRTVKSWSVNNINGSITLPLQDAGGRSISSGIYHVIIQNSLGTSVQKLIIE